MGNLCGNGSTIEQPGRPIPADVKKAMQKIDKLQPNDNTLITKPKDIEALGDILLSTDSLFVREHCETITDHLFDVAVKRVSSSADKEIVESLRKMVRSCEQNLYRP